MRSVLLGLTLGLASLMFVGCTRTDKFDITVRNDTGSPLTLALTKDGPPFERLWAAPEDLAIESPKADEQHGFVVLPAGKEADVSLQGKFAQRTRGYLRAYRGDLQISDMNAINASSPNRVDLPLSPGFNRVVITEADGRLTTKRGESPTSKP